MEPQVKPAENTGRLGPDDDLVSFNGAASKTCGKRGLLATMPSQKNASMEPQVKPAENQVGRLISSQLTRFNGAASKTCGKPESDCHHRVIACGFNGAASKTCGKHLT